MTENREESFRPDFYSSPKKRIEAEHVNKLLEEQNPYFMELWRLPLFNPMTPPKKVVDLVVKSLKGEEYSFGHLPTVGTLLSGYYGIGKEPRTLAEMEGDFGYTKSLSGAKNGVLFLLKRHAGIKLSVSEAPDKINMAISIGLRLDRARAAQAKELPKYSREGSFVSDSAARLLAWGISSEVVADLLNDHLLSVAKYGAPKINTGLVGSVDADLRGVSRLSKDVRHDKWEHAAIVLDKFENKKGDNNRARLITKLLFEIHNGASNEKVMDKFEIDSVYKLTQLLKQARRELYPYPEFYAELSNMFQKLVGVSDPEDKSITGTNTRKTIKNLYPLYLEFRKSLGDEPDKNLFSHLSINEKRVLELTATGKKATEIGKEFGLDRRDVGADVEALLKPDYGSVKSPDERKQEYQHIIQTLKKVQDDDQAWPLHYERREDIEKDLERIAYLLEHSWGEAVKKIPRSQLWPLLKRARAVVENVERKQETLWRAG